MTFLDASAPIQNTSHCHAHMHNAKRLPLQGMSSTWLLSHFPSRHSFSAIDEPDRQVRLHLTALTHPQPHCPSHPAKHKIPLEDQFASSTNLFETGKGAVPDGAESCAPDAAIADKGKRFFLGPPPRTAPADEGEEGELKRRQPEDQLVIKLPEVRGRDSKNKEQQ